VNTLKFIGLLQLYFDSDHDTLPLDRKGSLHNDVRLDSHENLTKHDGGGGVQLNMTSCLK